MRRPRESEPRRRCRATLVAVGSAAALLLFAVAAQAETITLGPALTGPGSNGYTCSPAIGGGCGEMLLSTSLPSVQIASPVDGTVVRWRIKGASSIPGYSLDVLRHNGDGSYTVTASTGSVTPTGNEFETFDTSLRIHVGEYVELNLPQGGQFTALEGPSTYATFFPNLESGETTQQGGEFEYPFTFAYNAEVESEPPPDEEPKPTPTPTPTPTVTPAPSVPTTVPDPKLDCILPKLEGLKLRTARETVRPPTAPSARTSRGRAPTTATARSSDRPRPQERPSLRKRWCG
jgi:hypothetical protein